MNGTDSRHTNLEAENEHGIGKMENAHFETSVEVMFVQVSALSSLKLEHL
jgi:hypothetical protein